jgi:hypothetical protein
MLLKSPQPLLILALAIAAGSALLAAPRKPAPTAARPALTEAEARLDAAMLEDAYRITLQTVHERYPTGTGQPVVAAAVVRQLQARMTARGWPKSRFLAVNALVMNPEHRPEDAFERDAVTALRSGADRFEKVEGGRLRVASSLSLGGSCFRCHWSDARIGSRAAICFDIPLARAVAASARKNQ